MTKSPLDRFASASRSATPRIIGASVGEPGSGKTHFWLTAPGPIVVQSFDQGLEGVVEQFTDTKDVRAKEYDWVPTDELSQDDAITLRDEFIADFELACQHARTIIWDTETAVWELFRYAEFGAPNDNPRNYPSLNQRMRKYVNLPKKYTINFGLVQSLKDEWVSKTNVNTGKTGAVKGDRRKRTGFSEVEGLVHVDMFHERRDGKFYTTIGKSRGPGCRDIQDQTYDGLDFKTLGLMLFPDSEEENWL